MADSKVPDRRSCRHFWRHTFVIVAVHLSVASFAGTTARAGKPSRTPLLRLSGPLSTPQRLPVVESHSVVPSHQVRLVGHEQPSEMSAAELDALVDSWFAEVSPEPETTGVIADEETSSLSAIDADQKSVAGAKKVVAGEKITDGGEIASANPAPASWLRSSSSYAADEIACRMVEQASHEFEVGAWLSAETSAWNAVRWAAESIDLAARERGQVIAPSSLESLYAAREAIREARDFSGIYGPLNGDVIRRMARSHQTSVLDNVMTDGLTATDASDRYLDVARVLLAPIAKRSVQAARGMDLLAAIYLGRADSKTLPSATALCLRRAALQGQPNNASLASRLGMHLADLGLLAEARWALEHSLAIRHDPATADTLVQVLRRSGRNDLAARMLGDLQNQSKEVTGGRLQPGMEESGSPIAAASSVDAGPRSGQGGTAVPEIVELSPQDFASISPSVVSYDRSARNVQAPAGSARVIPAGTRIDSRPQQAVAVTASDVSDSDRGSEKKPGLIRRFFGAVKGIW